MSRTDVKAGLAAARIQYARQADKLSLSSSSSSNAQQRDGYAVDAEFITPLDPVIRTQDGHRLPAVPVEEADKINSLKDQAECRKPRRTAMRPRGLSRFSRVNGGAETVQAGDAARPTAQHKLGGAMPPSRTHPLFPPLPLYGPPSMMRNLQCVAFRVVAFFLSTAFLLVIVLGSIFTSIGPTFKYLWIWLTFRDPDKRRPFYEEELHRAEIRHEEEKAWAASKKEGRRPDPQTDEIGGTGMYEPLEGGPDPLVCSARYYARRVGLEMEEFKVQTEDGFIITLWHVYDPKEYKKVPELQRAASSPNVFQSSDAEGKGPSKHSSVKNQYKDGSRRYPVLLMHGLLQSAGAYCVNDESSLAFFLHKSGYDVWLGNNRCGFHPEHTLLSYHDPRMWAWNIRQMGVLDLPALISRVLEETGFPRLALIAHSQGTTETFVALAKEQRPDLGDKISIFCALAPAVYAGPLIGKMYFKFMRVISPSMFRVFFGIHAFIPLMMTMHKYLPGKLYGAMGYRVFSFLFNWTDTRWDRGLRDRFFLFSPVYVSSESMRWWLGRECFAKQRCILSTREEAIMEDEEDRMKELEREAEQYNREDSSDGESWSAGEDEDEDEDENKEDDELQQEKASSSQQEKNEHETEPKSSYSTTPDLPQPTDPNNEKHITFQPQSKPQPQSQPPQSSPTSSSSPPKPKTPRRSSDRSDPSRSSWYAPPVPPMALWIAGSDALVDGARLLRRFARGREPHVRLVHTRVIDEYEHLDVLWAMDAIDKVGIEVRECVWRCMNEDEREKCRKIVGTGIKLSGET